MFGWLPLDWISDWTDKQKMKINEKKTKCMVFNYTSRYQFNPKLYVRGEQIDVIDSTPLLGTIITSDLSWEENTSYHVKKSNARIELLRRVASFGVDIHDLRKIYILFVRSQLEQSAVGSKYQSYRKSLDILSLEPLEQRREYLCLKFAQRCTKNVTTKQMFPLNEKIHGMDLRSKEKFKVQHANTQRLKNSAIIYMQNLLNKQN